MSSAPWRLFIDVYACCIVSEVSLAPWRLFTRVCAWCVVCCVLCPCPLGAFSPVCVLDVLCAWSLRLGPCMCVSVFLPIRASRPGWAGRPPMCACVFAPLRETWPGGAGRPLGCVLVRLTVPVACGFLPAPHRAGVPPFFVPPLSPPFCWFQSGVPLALALCGWTPLTSPSLLRWFWSELPRVLVGCFLAVQLHPLALLCGVLLRVALCVGLFCAVCGSVLLAFTLHLVALFFVVFFCVALLCALLSSLVLCLTVSRCAVMFCPTLCCWLLFLLRGVLVLCPPPPPGGCSWCCLVSGPLSRCCARLSGLFCAVPCFVLCWCAGALVFGVLPCCAEGLVAGRPVLVFAALSCLVRCFVVCAAVVRCCVLSWFLSSSVVSWRAVLSSVPLCHVALCWL